MIDVTELVGTVFSGLSALVIDNVEDAGEVIVVRAKTRAGAVACPGCGAETRRVHGYHERTAADAPVDGRRVVVKVRARRMLCPALGCTVQTFREQVPGVLERYRPIGMQRARGGHSHGSGVRASDLSNLCALPAWTQSLVSRAAEIIPRIFRIMETSP